MYWPNKMSLLKEKSRSRLDVSGKPFNKKCFLNKQQESYSLEWNANDCKRLSKGYD